MARNNPYLPKVAATPVKQVPRKRYQAALDAMPASPASPSVQASVAHPVDLRNYTPREVKAAQYGMDFNGGQTRSALSFVEGAGFPGFPILALLSQLAEYRSMHETLADECIRAWGEVTSTGNTDKAVLKALEAELDRIDMRSAVRQAVVDDQRFGRSHVFFRLKGDDLIRDTPLLLRPYSVRKGSFDGVRNIEAYQVTPNAYNSIDPTKNDFYKPSSWWALTTEIHATRMQTLVSRPVPDMLKPAYSFAGVSMTQLAMPYVDNWLRTRQSISDTVKQFSITGVKTDLSQMLAPGAASDLELRAKLLNAYRDNRNIAFLDMATEEFFQINTPLSGLDALQAQAQEQMSAVSHIPLVKLLGITPSGLNASSEGEIRVYYDYVAGYQKNVLLVLMRNALRLAQLSLYGSIDPSVDWKWTALMELTELEQAELREKDSAADERYFNMGAISAEQVAETLQHDPDSRYSGILDAPDSLNEIDDADVSAIAEFIQGNPGGEAPRDDTAALAAPATPQSQMVS